MKDVRLKGLRTEIQTVISIRPANRMPYGLHQLSTSPGCELK